MIKAYARLAYISIRHRKVRTWLTMLGIFIGIAAVVSLVSLSQGLQNAVEEQFSQLGTDKLIVQAQGGGFGPPGTGTSTTLTKDDKELIEKVGGVDLVVGRLIRVVQVEKDKEQKYTYAATLPEDNEELALTIEANDYNLAQGRFSNEGKEIIIGASIAQDFFENEVFLRDRILIQAETFKVVGILEKTGLPQQDNSLLLPEEQVRVLLDIPQAYDIVPLRVQTGEDVEVVKERVTKELRKFRNLEEGKEDFTVESPTQIIATLQNILAVIQGVLVGLAAISLVVGGIGIMNTMYTAVYERTKEIGLMKATGATKKKILTLFLIESGFLGAVGGLIGIAIGMGISYGVSFVAKASQNVLLQASFSPLFLLIILLFAFGIGALSGTLPAFRAANLHPVEALRK